MLERWHYRFLALTWFWISLLVAAQTEPPREPFSGLRLAHLSPDAPLVDLLVDGDLLLRDSEFSVVSSYLYIPAGRHELKIFPHRSTNQPTLDLAADQTPDEEMPPSEPVRPLEPFTISVDVEADRYYTVTLSGFFNPPAAQEETGSLSLEFDRDAGAISAQVQGPRGFLVMLEQSQTLEQLEPGTYTVTASGEGLRTAEYELRIASGEVTTLPISLQQAEPDSASRPTEVVEGVSEPQGDPVWHRSQLQLYEDDLALPAAGHVLLRVIHAAPGAGSVALYRTPVQSTTDSRTEAEAVAIVEALSFPNASPYLELSAGEQTLEFRLAGTDLVLTTYTDADLIAGTVYTFYLVANVSDQALTPLPSVDAILRASPFD